MLEHGGCLHAAEERWGIALSDWIDLSTGIAPWSYPVRISAEAWQRLPEDDDELGAIAAHYYGHPSPLPLPGSQAAIQCLPRLIPAGVAVLPAPTFGEYAPAWRAAGHEVREVAFDDLAAAANDADVLMLANPNNPTAARLDASELCVLAERLAARDAWLVVDEAFADVMPEQSLAALAGTVYPRLIVLRSLGKFFGLAGARVGFCCAAPTLNDTLAAAIGPWAVAHPSRQAAAQALADVDWQDAQRLRLKHATARLSELLARHGFSAVSAGDLFCYVALAQASALHEFLARRGILLRLFTAPSALRFGLPADEAAWQRLSAALTDWSLS